MDKKAIFLILRTYFKITYSEKDDKMKILLK